MPSAVGRWLLLWTMLARAHNEGPDVGGPRALLPVTAVRGASGEPALSGPAGITATARRNRSRRSARPPKRRGWIYDRTCWRCRRNRAAERRRHAAGDRFAVPDGRPSPTSFMGRLRSTTPTSRTSSSSDRTVNLRITCQSSPTTWTWRSRMSCGATITSRTRRSTCSSSRRSEPRSRSSPTCRSSSAPTRSA